MMNDNNDSFILVGEMNTSSNHPTASRREALNRHHFLQMAPLTAAWREKTEVGFS